MMMVPYMFNDGLMDDLFSDAWAHDFDRAMRAVEPRSMFGKRAANVMKTDARSVPPAAVPAASTSARSWSPRTSVPNLRTVS